MGRHEADPADVLILRALRQQTEGYVSGSTLAAELAISRAAVSKRVAVLREAGWEIDALPRLGYRLVAEPLESLHPLVLEAELETAWLGRTYRHLDEVDSTNSELSRLAEGGAPAGCLVVAEQQREGRGRLGRRWESALGQGLYASFLLRPDWAPSELPPLTLAVAVAVARGIEPFLGQPPVLKWPNDLLAPDGRKLCGILCEMSAEFEHVRHLVVGVGLNVNQPRFARALGAIATSMRQVTGRSHSRAAVLVALLDSLERWLDPLLDGDEAGRDAVLDEWLVLADPWLGDVIEVQSSRGTISGRAVGIDTRGALLLEDRFGTSHRIVSGDVKLS